MAAAALLLVLVGIATPVLMNSGLIWARLEVVHLDGSQGPSDRETKRFSVRFGIKNITWRNVTITSAGASSSYLKLVDVEGLPLPHTLAPEATWEVSLVYEVTNCDGFPNEEWPIPFQVERSWGSQTIELLPPDYDPDVPEDLFPEDEPPAWPWMADRANHICQWFGEP